MPDFSGSAQPRTSPSRAEPCRSTQPICSPEVIPASLRAVQAPQKSAQHPTPAIAPAHSKRSQSRTARAHAEAGVSAAKSSAGRVLFPLRRYPTLSLSALSASGRRLRAGRNHIASAFAHGVGTKHP
jgi:hypothetical protein